MRQTIKARHHVGILQPLEPLALANDAEVQVTMETAAVSSPEDILRHAADVYRGLTTQEIAQIETIVLKRRHLFRKPTA